VGAGPCYGVEVGVLELGVVVVLVGGVGDVVPLVPLVVPLVVPLEVPVEVPVVPVVVPVVVLGVVVVDAVEAAAGSVVLIGVLVALVELPESECLTFDVAAVAAPLTFSLMTGAASLACWAVCWTLGLLLTRVAA
jgi:hypothetical protein